ncbi:Peptidoglycan-N-acetylglucosamine deacetylase [Paenibacillus solanacearum]|uniref:Peptidoglycan-N-acetylglucosamine deacetylase n=1 Tax=Paenibacillus solanacearum TaxID=2048548 RepID=A0A916NS06_9BACL|nr:polysaccharide deacetylase family protein [Paenibacillus solanacearum]CAG7646610.1 Peptidoglycan-N-acetylglucosamine deacetylase [Paenibacillus solanacearum]
MSKLIREHRTSRKTIALTFDDGPDPLYTPAILDVLKAAGATASFFVLGEKLEHYPELARRIAREGHDLGNHTYSHPDLARVEAERLDEELIKTDRLIGQITGKKPCLFRPPYLSSNRQVTDSAQKLGYLTIMASVDTKDYKRPATKNIVHTALSKMSRGSIILMHDSGGDRRQTVKAVEILMGKLGHRRYTCVSVSRLLQLPLS